VVSISTLLDPSSVVTLLRLSVGVEKNPLELTTGSSTTHGTPPGVKMVVSELLSSNAVLIALLPLLKLIPPLLPQPRSQRTSSTNSKEQRNYIRDLLTNS